MATSLNPGRYVPVGAYTSEIVQASGTNLDTATRIPTYIGVGSRLINQANLQISRAYINDAPLAFTATSPHTAALSPLAVCNKSMTTIVDSKAVAVRNDLWYFNSDGSAVVIADAAYRSGEVYTISYQSADASIGDALPYAGIREITSVGTFASQSQFERNTDFYLSTSVGSVSAKTDLSTGEYVHYTNSTSTFTPVVHSAGAGSAKVALDAYTEFNHNYSRSYTLQVVASSSTAYTFAWTATPIASGNDAAPSVPLTSAVSSPTFLVDSTLVQTQTVTLEYGVKVDFDFSGSTSFVVGDTYTFSAYAPALIEPHSAFANKNQFAVATDVIAAEDNTGVGSVVVDVDNYTGATNLNVQLNVVSVDPAISAASVPVGALTLTGSPVDGQAFVVSNGLAGTKKATRTFEFDTDGVRSVADSILVPVSTIAATYAVGGIAFGTASAPIIPADGDVLVLNDGSSTYTFEFDSDNNLTNRSAVRVVIDTTSELTAANLASAINNSAVRLTATNDVASTYGKITLTNKVAGTIGNAANSYTGSAAVILTQPTNGTDASVDLVATTTALIASLNSASSALGLVATADSSTVGLVHLTYGAQFTLTALPVAADTVTVALGSTTNVFTFRALADATGATDVAIGTTVAATVANLAAKLSNEVTYLVAHTDTTVTVAHAYGRSLTLSKTSSAVTVLSSVVDNASASSVGNVAITAVGTLSNVTLSGMSGGVVAADAPDHLTFAWGVGGDIFAGGTFTVAETDKATKEFTLVRGIKVKLSQAIASHATGSVVFHSKPTATDLLTITDGLGESAHVFEFSNTGTVTSGHTPVLIGGSIATTAANLVAAVNAASTGLAITASLSGNTVTLVNDKTGTGASNAYNTAITTTSTSLTVTGFAGGQENYSVGDVYTFTVKAPRKFPTAYDSRTVEFTVSQVGLTGSGVTTDNGYVALTYSSSTPEGGFGSVTASTANYGYFSLPGQLTYAVRNTIPTVSGANRFTLGDKFTTKFVNNEVLYWDLDTKVAESFTADDILVDRSGAVTGSIGALYIALEATPVARYGVKVTMGGVAFTDYKVSGNQILLTATSVSAITGTLIVNYVSVGSEPSLGSTYYISGNYKRPASKYNTLLTYSTYEDARDALAPMTADNNLAIINELAWSQAYTPVKVGFIQIEDSDDDGVISTDDVTNALEAAASVSGITEITPIGLSSFLGKVMAFDEKGQDPFEKREHITWYGFPIGTPVGDSNTVGTLVYYAQNTLKSYGSALTHGRRVMVGHTKATMTITLYDGTDTSVTLDGSFINGAACALWAARPNNSTTLLKKNLLGFDTIDTYSDVDNNTLGAASIIWLKPNGKGVYQFMEDITIDNSDATFQSLLATGTKLDAERVVRREMDAGLVGVVADTPESGVSLVRTKLVTILSGLVSQGLIAPYQTSDGSPRAISSDDILVYVDSSDPTLYNFFYVIYSRTVIKRLYGMYSVNKNLFTASAS